MPSINVTGAAARLRAYGRNEPGKCLQFVWAAISQGRFHYLSGGANSAYETWQATDPASRHNGDRNVPKDMPAYFGPRPGNAFGDVIISNGDGTFTATDRPSGHIGVCTLLERGVQIGRPYLGWAETMGGYTLSSTSTASTSGTPLIPISEKHLSRKRANMYLVHDIKNGTGSYLVTDVGCTGILGAVENAVWRMIGSPSDGTQGVPVNPNIPLPMFTPLYKSEIDELDAVLRANARLNNPAGAVSGATDLTPIVDALATQTALIKALPAAPRTFVAQ